MTDEVFNFTWGLPILKELGYVQLFRFMLTSYIELGVTRPEMLVLIHLASYHYNVEEGQSRPSLATIGQEMGYADRTNVSRLIASLEKKGMLIVHRRPGYTSVYDASPFAEAAFNLWLIGVGKNRTGEGVCGKPQGGCADNVTGGCAENRKGGVRKTAHETEEINTRIETENQEEIPATSVAESPAMPPENSPEPSPSGEVDYLEHCADLAAKNNEPWTVPAEAGGGDGLGKAMLDAWLEQKGVVNIPGQLRAKWTHRLSKLALDSGLMFDNDGNPALTREQATRAVEIVLEPGSAEFGYYTYNDPANRKFQQDWIEVALRLLNGGSGYRNGNSRESDGKGKNLYSEEGRAAQRERLAKRGVFLD